MIVRLVRTITALLRLPESLRQEAFEYVMHLRKIDKIDKEASAHSETNDKTPRIAGLHAGEGWISEDFDEPLPDELWVGREM